MVGPFFKRKIVCAVEAHLKFSVYP